MKRSRGLMSYVVIIGALVLISMLLSGGLNGHDFIRIEYPELLELIEKDQVEKVAISGTALVGVLRGTRVLASDFPGRYDFETTIGGDFIDTAIRMEAKRLGVDAETLSVSDLRFTVQYPQPQGTPWWLELLPFFLTVVLLVVFWVLMMRAQGGGNSKVMNFGKSRARMQDPAKNKITFENVAGADEEKEELQEMVDFLRNPRAYIDMGARIPKGVLLVGPPGTGKTLLAKAVAGEAGVPFFSISGSDFVEMFVGVGASRVRDLFDQAKKSAPSIVFIDEIDAVGRHRGAGLGGGHDEREQTLNQLLVEMDGFAVNEGVIVMAATNRRDILDPALLRPGRFDRQVTVNYPDLDGRVAILKVHSKGKPLADDVDLKVIAKRMPFGTGAELENVMNEAAILSARARRKKIDQKTLLEAISRVQMGPEKRSHKVSERDKEMVAIHEAGHAIVGHFAPQAHDVHLVTIVPRGNSAGHTLSLPGEEHELTTRSQLMARIAVALGGHAAEQRGLGEFTTGATSDLQHATELCRRMVTMFGMSEEIGPVYLDSDQEVFVGMEFGQSRSYSEEVAAKIDREVRKLLDEGYQLALQMIDDNRERFDLLVKMLVAHDTLSRKEFVTLMETGEYVAEETEHAPDALQDAAEEKTETAAEGAESAEEAAAPEATDDDTQEEQDHEHQG